MDTDGAFLGRLLPGERVRWSGRPKPGLLFTGEDAFIIPFSLVWCMVPIGALGLAGFGWVKITDILSLVMAWVFIAFGLYMLAGRFVVDAWVRGRTDYAVTDLRVLISRGGPFSKFTAISLKQLALVEIKERSDGRGNIRFGPTIRWVNGEYVMHLSPALDPTPQFLAIEKPREVFDLLQRLSKAS